MLPSLGLTLEHVLDVGDIGRLVALQLLLDEQKIRDAGLPAVLADRLALGV